MKMVLKYDFLPSLIFTLYSLVNQPSTVLLKSSVVTVICAKLSEILYFHNLKVTGNYIQQLKELISKLKCK